MDPIPEPPESPRLLRPRGVGEILVDAFGLYRLHWRNLIAIVAIVVVPLTLVQVLVTEVVIDETEIERRIADGADGGFEVTIGEVSGADVTALVLGALTVLIVSVLTWAILTGAITRAAAGTFLGRDLRIEDTYRYGLARLGAIVLVGVLVALAVVGGFILLVIPGFFVLTRLWVSMPALVIEDRRGREALRRSWSLVKGFGWPVFGTIVVTILISGLISSLLTAPFGENTLGQIIGQAVAAVITTPYTVLVGILIYLNLRVRKEQYGVGDLERDLARTSAA
jgi:hypothetical protein